MTNADTFTRLRHILAHTDLADPRDIRRSVARVRRRLDGYVLPDVTNDPDLPRTITKLEELLGDACQRGVAPDFIRVVQVVLERARAHGPAASPTAPTPTASASAPASNAPQATDRIDYDALIGG